METPSERISRDAAREALRQVRQDEDAVRYPPLPRWFFPVMAAIVAGLALVRMLPSDDALPASVALSVIALVLGTQHWLNRDGVAWVSPSLRDMVPFLGGILGTFGVCAAVEAATGVTWVWAPGAAVLAGIVLWTGRSYRRTYGG